MQSVNAGGKIVQSNFSWSPTQFIIAQLARGFDFLAVALNVKMISLAWQRLGPIHFLLAFEGS